MPLVVHKIKFKYFRVTYGATLLCDLLNLDVLSLPSSCHKQCSDSLSIILYSVSVQTIVIIEIVSPSHLSFSQCLLSVYYVSNRNIENKQMQLYSSMDITIPFTLSKIVL